MKCPYNRKSEKHIQKWGQKVNDDNILTNGITENIYTFELAECLKEDCGAWHNGRCCYASVNLENQ